MQIHTTHPVLGGPAAVRLNDPADPATFAILDLGAFELYLSTVDAEALILAAVAAKDLLLAARGLTPHAPVMRSDGKCGTCGVAICEHAAAPPGVTAPPAEVPGIARSTHHGACSHKAAPADLQCETSVGGELFCYLVAGHDGDHWDCVDGHFRAADGGGVITGPCPAGEDAPAGHGALPAFTEPPGVDTTCTRVRPGNGIYRCTRADGHEGSHQDITGYWWVEDGVALSQDEAPAPGDGPCCDAGFGGTALICTRRPHRGGDHVAHGTAGQVLHRWPQDGHAALPAFTEPPGVDDGTQATAGTVTA